MPLGPRIPMLMTALAMPGAAMALGLGDIHVNSALNEPLSAQIDIVGASSAELQTLNVRIADAEKFQRYNADRPSYLSSVTFRLGTDAQGRPVLDLRSNAAFVDPVVELLVDIRWRDGELVRDYSLLLDPATLAPVAVRETAPVVSAATVAAAPVAASPAAALPVAAPPVAAPPAEAQGAAVPVRVTPVHAPTPVPQVESAASAYRVRPGDTLSGIVRHAGVPGAADAQRMMIAVFRGNPDAFDGNINLLRRDALLALPPVSALAAMDAAQASRDVAEQMNAWRRGLGVRPAPVPSNDPYIVPTLAVDRQWSVRVNSTIAGLPQPLILVQAPVAAQPPVRSQAPDPAQPASAAQSPPVTPATATNAPRHGAAVAPAVQRREAEAQSPLLATIALIVGLPLAGLALLQGRRIRTAVTPRPADYPEQPGATDASAVPEAEPARQPEQPNVMDGTVEMQIADDSPTAELAARVDETLIMAETTQRMEGVTVDDTALTSAMMATATVETTASIPQDMATVVLEGVVGDDAILEASTVTFALQGAQDTVLDYNLVDLDATAQHVHMPSELNDRPSFVERRTNVVEALRAAIARDPHRNDLRMKLLETCYTMAAANRRAFAEYVRLQAAEPGALTAADWQKIAMMGQELGLRLELPAAKDSDDLAHCA